MKTTKTKSWRFCATCFAALLLIYCPSLLADTQKAADYYRGKVIKLVVGYAPGGGYDTLARLLAPRLESKTGATVIVDNRPGGGGIVAMNQVVTATPDGLTIMLVNGPAMALAQMLELEGARFDLLQIPWLGRVTAEPSVMMVNKDSPYQRIEDMQRAEQRVTWAAGGKADNLSDTAACASEALGLNSRIIIGYKGSKESSLAVMRGEVDGIVITASSARKYAKAKKLRPLLVLGRDRSPLFPDLPTVFEAVELDDEQAWWIDFRSKVGQIGRALMSVPATPGERVDFLRNAFQQILNDPAFVAEAEAKRRLINYTDAENLRGLVVDTVGSLGDEQLARVRAVVLEKYYR